MHGLNSACNIFCSNIIIFNMAMTLQRPKELLGDYKEPLLFKRNLRIKSSRLPPNFFTRVPNFRYELAPLISQDFTTCDTSR
jgi:hypothetical protein